MYSLIFASGGRTLFADIKKLRTKIRKLAKTRSADVERLNTGIQVEEGRR